jgi:hypothetical protein
LKGKNPHSIEKNILKNQKKDPLQTATVYGLGSIPDSGPMAILPDK